VPSIDKFNDLFDFTCNCVNKWGDWRITAKRNRTTSFGVSENDTGYFFQADFNMEVFGHTLRGNAGTRVAITEVSSYGETQAGRPIRGYNRYTDFLPSMNLTYEPMRNLLLRFSASRVMARPLLGNLSPTIQAISVPNDGSTIGGTLTIGNPKLSPFRSTNYDFSAEWYFAPGGLFSVAAFSKDISSFPQTVLYEARLSEFADPETIAAIRAQYTNVQQQAYLDNNYTFLARQFRDAPGGWLRGVEVSFQQDLTFLPGFLKNLGVQINGTYIKSKLNYILDPGTATIPATMGTAPFLGVSPKALNATLYYETEKFRIRVSGAYRKGYSTTYPLAAGSCAPGVTVAANGTPTYCGSPLINDFVFSRSTLNIDASTSYQITKWLSVSAEALNLTNQTSERYAYQAQNAVSQYASSGPIFRAGARLRF
jgi:TonB-dependent receptor